MDLSPGQLRERFETGIWKLAVSPFGVSNVKFATCETMGSPCVGHCLQDQDLPSTLNLMTRKLRWSAAHRGPLPTNQMQMQGTDGQKERLETKMRRENII